MLAAERTRRPRLFDKLRILQLDEWGGLPAVHPASCRADLNSKLIDPLAIAPSRFQAFRGDAPDAEAECQRMRRWLGRHGPIDVCVLGLGVNGHVAMNEPTPALVPHAHVAKLTASSRKHSMLAGIRSRPAYGLTLGLTEILASCKILLLVSGAAKTAILKRTLEPRVTTQLPASFLSLHPDYTLLCDRLAASNPF
jgi:galactosamine-6-phosphate isomerase